MGVGACALGFAAGVLTAFSPCVLPLLAVTVTTAFQRHRYGPLALAAGLAGRLPSRLSATAVLGAFSLGAALPLVIIAYGSRELFGRRAADVVRIARPLTATVLIVVGVLTLSGGDRVIETKLVDLMPMWLIALTSRF